MYLLKPFYDEQECPTTHGQIISLSDSPIAVYNIIRTEYLVPINSVHKRIPLVLGSMYIEIPTLNKTIKDSPGSHSPTDKLAASPGHAFLSHYFTPSHLSHNESTCPITGGHCPLASGWISPNGKEKSNKFDN